jgi:hypothetical protein
LVAFDAPVMVMYFLALMPPAYDKATAIQLIGDGKYEPNRSLIRLTAYDWKAVLRARESPDRSYERSGD